MYTRKKQLILLMYCKFTYKQLVQYLNYCKEKLVPELLTLNEFHTLIKQLFNFSVYNYLNMNSLDFEECITNLEKHSIMIGETIYPDLWYEIEQPPLIVFYKGNLNILRKPCLSIVGTRNITNYGKRMTQRIVQACVEQNWVCVSGLAKGVDTYVHRTALKSGNESTIAILPCGFEHYYPKENCKLQNELASYALIISEYLPINGVRKHQFIMRNRLVAGLSPVTIVIESAFRSGSLITANYALQFNREVYSLPGRIDDRYSQGCNDLIRAGANPVYSVSTLIEEIQTLFQNHLYLHL